MKYELKLDMDFDAAHHLPDYPGDCSRVHGHCWRVIVSMIGDTLDGQHMLIDFKKVKQLVNQLDHQHINDFIPHPTAENIAAFIFNEIDNYLKSQGGRRPSIDYVTVFESKGASITVRELN